MISTTPTRLGDIVQYQNGGAWSEDAYAASGVSVVRVSDCKEGRIDLSDCKFLDVKYAEQYQRHALEEDDLLIATVGSHPTQPNSAVGRATVVSKEIVGAYLNQNNVCLRPKQDPITITKKYLGYVGQSDDFKSYILGCARGAASQVRMPIELLMNYCFELPSISYQQKVEEIIAPIDSLIRNNLKRISELEALCRLLYRDWFVQFKYPGHEDIGMVDSGHPEIASIPVGWKIFTLRELISNYIGGGWGEDESNDDHTVQAKVIRGTDIPKARIGAIKALPERWHKSSNYQTRQLDEEDIIFEVSGGSKDQPVGRSLILTKSHLDRLDRKVICASFCKRIQIKKELVSPFHVYLALNHWYSDGTIPRFEVQSTGITNFKFEPFLDSVSIAIPPEPLKTRLHRMLEDNFNLIASIGHRNEVLAGQRNLLLAQLMSLQLDISDLDLTVPHQECAGRSKGPESERIRI